MQGSNIVISINWIYFLGLLGTIVVIAWKASSKFSIIETNISHIKKKVDKTETNVEKIRDRFASVEAKVETMWKDQLAPASSPRQLNERGRTVLEESGIKEVVDTNKEKLLAKVKEEKASNAYDAEKAILSVMVNLPKHCPEEIENIKEGAFRVGADIDAVLFVGAIYLRNLIFKDLGFSLEDLDKPKKENWR